MGQKLVITGGAGLLAVNCSATLRFNVTIVDNLKRNRGSVAFEPDPRVTHIDADVTSTSHLVVLS